MVRFIKAAILHYLLLYLLIEYFQFLKPLLTQIDFNIFSNVETDFKRILL